MFVKPDPKHLTVFAPDIPATGASPIFHHPFVETVVLLESMAKGKCIEVQVMGVERAIVMIAEARDRQWIYKTMRLVRQYKQQFYIKYNIPDTVAPVEAQQVAVFIKSQYNVDIPLGIIAKQEDDKIVGGIVINSQDKMLE